MKITLSTSEIADRLFEDKNAGFSYAGARALAKHLEETTDEDTEFDGVAIRGDFSEYDSAVSAAETNGWEKEGDDEDAQEEAALDWLKDQTTIIEFKGGIIIQAF